MMYVKYILIVLLLYFHIYAQAAAKKKGVSNSSGVSLKKTSGQTSSTKSTLKSSKVVRRVRRADPEGDGEEEDVEEGQEENSEEEKPKDKKAKFNEYTAFMPVLDKLICSELVLLRDYICGYACKLSGNGKAGRCNKKSTCVCDAYDIKTKADHHPTPKHFSFTCRLFSFLGVLPCTMKCQFLGRGRVGSCDTGVCVCSKLYPVSVDKRVKQGGKSKKKSDDEDEDEENEDDPMLKSQEDEGGDEIADGADEEEQQEEQKSSKKKTRNLTSSGKSSKLIRVRQLTIDSEKTTPTDLKKKTKSPDKRKTKQTTKTKSKKKVEMTVKKSNNK